jgi:hypothetical protein
MVEARGEASGELNRQPSSDNPSADEVRAQVDRMIASEEFVRSPQLGAFLRFVVDAALEGRADRLKAYTIGVGVLRRDEKFDPQYDPIVRVEATRLRRTIDRYYAGPGAEDTVRVDLPRGSYVPAFSRRAVAAAVPRAAPHWRPALALAAVAAMFAAAVAGALVYRSWQREPLIGSTLIGAKPLPPGNGMPVLFMPPFEIAGYPGPRSIPARSLHAALSDAFTHFDLVNVLLDAPDHQAYNGSAPLPGPRADLRFNGSIEYAEDGGSRLLFRLVDAADSSIAWSRVFDRVPPGDDQSSEEEKVVRELAGILLQPFGVIYAHQRAKVLSGTVTDPRYSCLVTVIDSFASFEPKQQARGRDCLQQLTARDPGFGIGYSYLAALDLREHQYGFGRHENEDPPPLQRGLAAARKGIESNPESSRAYEMLFVILFARREIPAAFDAANKAITLNKYDMRSVGAYGARLIAVGNVERGLALLRQAGDDGTVRPPFEEFFLFLGEYLRGNATDAAFHAGQLTGDQFELGLIARALTAAAKDDRDAAMRALERLVALNPAWHDDLHGTLAKFFYDQAIIDRLAGDLAAAGLQAH